MVRGGGDLSWAKVGKEQGADDAVKKLETRLVVCQLTAIVLEVGPSRSRRSRSLGAILSERLNKSAFQSVYM